MKQWRRYFEHNRDHRLSIPWDAGVRPEAFLLRPLIPSMQRFQVGETGTGSHLRRKASIYEEDYQIALDLFIKEEQEHARLMGEVLRHLNAPLLTGHWSDHGFVLLRRLFGLRPELLVLLVPEMIAKRYFRALRDGTRDPVLSAVFTQIHHDEEGHLAFHTAFLQRELASLSLPARALWRVVWRIVFRLACFVVIFDHGSILRAVGVSRARFWWDAGLIFDEVAAGIFSCAPTPPLLQPALESA